MDIYNELPDTSRSTIQDANFTINESGLINILILKEASPNDILQMELDSEEIAAGMTVSDLKNKICSCRKLWRIPPQSISGLKINLFYRDFMVA